MPIIRKVTTVGAARGITLPKSWIDYIERKTGEKLTEVLLEINDVLKVIPVTEKTYRDKNENASGKHNF